MATAKKGDTVRVHYTGKHDDGTVFDTSRDSEPLPLTIGKHHVIKGFEDAIVGMNVGDTKTVRITADEAYGARREELTARFERTKFPKDINPEVGLHLQVKQPDGTVLNVLITEVSETEVAVDANHPFAGMDLNFDLELVAIV